MTPFVDDSSLLLQVIVGGEEGEKGEEGSYFFELLITGTCRVVRLKKYTLHIPRPLS